jgi:CHAD domain-containing protein
MEHASGVYMPNRMHRMRVVAKKLRYSIELADASGLRLASDLIDPLRKAQDVLGEIHDLDVLGEWVQACREGGDISPRDSEMLEALMALERSRLHASYLKRRDQIRDVCRTCKELAADAVTARAERLATRAAMVAAFTMWYLRRNVALRVSTDAHVASTYSVLTRSGARPLDRYGRPAMRDQRSPRTR